MAKNTPEAQGSLERGVALRGDLHSPRPSNIKGQCSVHCHNLHLHHRLGWWLRSSDLRKNGNGREELQARAILLGKGE